MILHYHNLKDHIFSKHRKLISFKEIEEILIEASQVKRSSVKLIYQENKFDSDMVSVEFDSNKYLLTYLTDDSDFEDEKEIRTYTNPNSNDSLEKVEINGDYWHNNMICYDFNIVKEVFRQFFETNKVSNKILN